MPSRPGFISSILFACTALLASCNRAESISLTVEDFRFVPDLVRVTSSSPMMLTVYNAGRETHEFGSPVLAYVVTTRSSPADSTSKNSGVYLEPRESIRLTMAPPAGTYLYICRRKGHANMIGTLIVE